MLTNKGIRGLFEDEDMRGLLGIGSLIVFLFAFMVGLAIEVDPTIDNGVVMDTVTFWIVSIIMVASMTCCTVSSVIDILEGRKVKSEAPSVCRQIDNIQHRN